jgi:hypothetical protein
MIPTYLIAANECVVTVMRPREVQALARQKSDHMAVGHMARLPESETSVLADGVGAGPLLAEYISRTACIWVIGEVKGRSRNRLTRRLLCQLSHTSGRLDASHIPRQELRPPVLVGDEPTLLGAGTAKHAYLYRPLPQRQTLDLPNPQKS